MPLLSHDEISKMSVADRMELMGEIWNSFSATEVPLTAAQSEELDRRLDSFDTDIQRAIPIDQVFARLERHKP